MKLKIACISILLATAMGAPGADEPNAFINLVTNLNAGSSSSVPKNLVSTDNALYFFADDGAGETLWYLKSGVVKKCVNEGFPDSAEPDSLVACGSDLYFLHDGTTTSLWVTSDAESFLPVKTNAQVTLMQGWDEKLLYVTEGSNLWRAAGSVSHSISSFSGGTVIQELLEVSPETFLAVTKSGTDPNSYSLLQGSVSNLVSVTSGLTDLAHDEMVVVENEFVYYPVENEGDMVLQWASLLTGETGLVASAVNPTSLTVIGNTVFFLKADDQENVYWTVGGNSTAESVIQQGSPGSTYYVGNLTGVASEANLFFVSSSSGYGLEPWRAFYSGISWYAECLDINTNYDGFGYGSDPENLYDFDGELVFSANRSGTENKQLWIYRDGEAREYRGETYTLFNHANFISHDYDLYFSAKDNSVGDELWKMSGKGRFVLLGYLLSSPVGDEYWDPEIIPDVTNAWPAAHNVSKRNSSGTNDLNYVLFTDPGARITLKWYSDITGTNETWSYRTRREPYAPDQTKLLYHTEDASRAPTIAFFDVPYNPVICANRDVYTSQEILGSNSVGEVLEKVDGHVWVDENNELHGDTDIVISNRALSAANDYVVIYYEDGNGLYQGHELIQIKRYHGDSVVGTNSVGDQLMPAPSSGYTNNGIPYVAAGKMETRDDEGFIYQHFDQGELNGNLYAVRENSVNELKMEVFWMRDGLYDVAWPYHMARYTTTWPAERAQRLIRRAGSVEPRVFIPSDLNPYKMPEEDFEEQFSHGYLEGSEFYTDGAGYSLMLLETGPPQRRDWLEFVVVKSVMNTTVDVFTNNLATGSFGTGSHFENRSTEAWPIGEIITNEYHRGVKAGYLFHTGNQTEDDYYHPGFYGEADAQGMHSGEIFAVNEGQLEVWWSNESHATNSCAHGVPEAVIQWPSYVMVYTNLWPDKYVGGVAQDFKDDIVIASEAGTGPIGLSDDQWALYYQNNLNQPGFNPNDEHAVVALTEAGDEGVGVFPLRADLFRDGELDCSEPYLVIENRSKTDSLGNQVNDLDIYKVVASNEPHAFVASANTVGALARVPYPLERGPLGICESTYRPNPEQSALWRDRKNWHWVRAEGNDPSMSEKIIRFYYKVQDGFYYPDWYTAARSEPVVVGDEVPWLDALSGGTNSADLGVPVDYEYDIQPAQDVPNLYLGQTLTKPIGGLPAVWDQLSVEIIHQQASHTNAGGVADTNEISVALIDPIVERKVAFTERGSSGPKTMSSALKDQLLQIVDGKSVFKDLPMHLQKRLIYDEGAGQGYLRFGGRLLEPSAGNHYLLLNVMNASDSNILVQTFTELDVFDSTPGSAGEQFESAIMDLIDSASAVDYAEENVPFANLALSTGPATAGGQVTLAFNNSTNTDINAPGDPISLAVINVSNTLYTGQIFPVNSDNAFDENLVMRHTLDFGGEGEYLYDWRYIEGSTEPDVGDPLAGWMPAGVTLFKNDGINENSLVVGGSPEFVLKDNFFTLRYKPISPDHPLYDTWSDWVSPPKIAQNWVKRVMAGINPFEQRVKSFDTYAPGTLMTMLEQVGGAYAGAVPLNLDHVDDYGLIEIYETVFDRALALSYEGAYNHNDKIDNTLLLASGRLADLYTIMGNEAYADAQNPTIGFGTEHGEYGAEASSIFCFQNYLPSLLDEELALLRGRDDSASPGVETSPHFNRLPWNMSWDIAGGEVAYALNYEITDVADSDGAREADGIIDEYDAAKLYPQGHGDAWGHYLSAISYYYRLLHTEQFQWQPRIETIELNLQNYQVDYLDERKFAKAAVARARTGNEVVGLTHRTAYQAGSVARLSGYADQGYTNRHWGVNDWAARVGQGGYFDWVVGNAMLPTNSPESGIAKVDRSTVVELAELAELGREVQNRLDGADKGLNPLGLAGNVVPFDISPAAIDQNQSHYEQIYSRAIVALNNAKTVFDHAQNSSQQLRRQFDSHEDFVGTVEDREFDFENRLIELYGYPYGNDIGPGKTYPQGYEGPDYYHYNYVDMTDLLGVVQEVKETNVTVEVQDVSEDGSITVSEKTIAVHYSGDLSFWEIKPHDWDEPRRAPGEIQMARSDVIQAIGRFLRAEIEYNNLVRQIEDQVELLLLQYGINVQEMLILNETKNTQKNLNKMVFRLRATQLVLQKIAGFLPKIASALSEAVPSTYGVIVGTSNGTILDPMGGVKAAIQTVGLSAADQVTGAADILGLVEQGYSQSKEIVSLESNIKITALNHEMNELQALKQLEQLVRSEASARLGLYTEVETIEQAAGRYHSAVQRAKRIEAERLRFRKQTAAQIQDYRYKDAAFRVFRNDALQRYRAQFDLAARYAYMAVRTYGYETCLFDEEHAGDFGCNKLEEQIVRARTIGYMANEQPVWGSDAGGLAEALGELDLNWFVIGSQLGFNSPQTETGRFSLRHEFLRILPGNDGDGVWQETLQGYVVDNIRDIPEFNKYCIPFNPVQDEEPGIVIPFSTTVNFGHNFFGWLAGGGDNSYDSANFATKIRSVGIWFSNYNNIQGGGLINTPRVYLVPVGSDVMRRPLGDRGDILEFSVLDQALPIPLSVGDSELADPSYLPMHDMGSDSIAQPRRHGTIRAYHDAGVFNDAETMNNSRLVGRSVWNTQWMLVIPAGTLHSDREEGIKRFIEGGLLPEGGRDGNGVKDIKLFFQTYAIEGQ